MAFIMEFAEHWIRSKMEHPDERDRRFREEVREVKAKCDSLVQAWSLPVKPYGSWTADKNNHKLLMDLKLSRLPGRTDPYDQIPDQPARKQ